jgi:PAS domain S-box-containing protein
MVVSLAEISFRSSRGTAMKTKTRGNGGYPRSIQPLSTEGFATEAFPQRSAFQSRDEIVESDFENTHRFALGTREISPINVAAITDDGEPLFAHASEDLELAAMPYSLFVIGKRGRIEYVNALAEALVGYTRVELMGQMFGRIVSDVGAALEAMTALEPRVRFLPAASGSCVHHRSGRDVPASVVLCPHKDGSVIALVTPLTAVDDHSVAEARLAEIVHDFKNPLATIALEMCLLEDKLQEQAHRDVSAVVRRVSRNVEFLDHMVQDLLDSCAIADGALALRRRPTDLMTLLKDVVERATPTRDRRRVFVEGPTGITLSIDELRIERVVANLLQNALKYTSHTSWIVVRLKACAGVALVSVIDAGAGMTPDELVYIFDKYRRTVGAGTREGNGLGLYVSKQIIEAHGGRIGVDSVRGIGSRFFFELPIT